MKKVMNMLTAILCAVLFCKTTFASEENDAKNPHAEELLPRVFVPAPDGYVKIERGTQLNEFFSQVFAEEVEFETLARYVRKDIFDADGMIKDDENAIDGLIMIIIPNLDTYFAASRDVMIDSAEFEQYKSAIKENFSSQNASVCDEGDSLEIGVVETLEDENGVAHIATTLRHMLFNGKVVLLRRFIYLHDIATVQMEIKTSSDTLKAWDSAIRNSSPKMEQWEIDSEINYQNRKASSMFISSGLGIVWLVGAALGVLEMLLFLYWPKKGKSI